jgi:hypothetical protein
MKCVISFQLPNGWAYGNIGLSRIQGFFFAQVAFQYNNTMSYCLVSKSNEVNTTSWESFGSQNSKYLSFTPLLGKESHFYVNLKGITIGNSGIDVLDITTLTYDNNSQIGGIILDTGGPSTYLQEPLHSRFLDAFIFAMKYKANIYQGH